MSVSEGEDKTATGLHFGQKVMRILPPGKAARQPGQATQPCGRPDRCLVSFQPEVTGGAKQRAGLDAELNLSPPCVAVMNRNCAAKFGRGGEKTSTYLK